mmetsp:Transcript_13251/g.38244  ORF Transcript_13251/g.38244 Transcript_13251/m.38244 type:complete len:224 (-) Transcript_13251:1768-2439(-)
MAGRLSVPPLALLGPERLALEHNFAFVEVHLPNVDVERLLQLPYHEARVGSDEVHDHPRIARPAHTTRPVDVVLGVGGQVQVDNVTQPRHVQPTCTQLCGDGHADLPVLHPLEHLRTVVLGRETGQRGRDDLFLQEVVDEPLDAALLIAETQDALVHRICVEEFPECLCDFVFPHTHEDVVYVGGDEGHPFVGVLDATRPDHVPHRTHVPFGGLCDALLSTGG